jgi:hypothetical protein
VKNKYSLQYTITVQYEIEVEKYNANLHSLIRRLREKQDGLYIFFPQKNPYNERCTVDATGGTRNRDKAIQ